MLMPYPIASFISGRDKTAISVPASEPIAGTIASVVLSLSAISILSSFIARRSLVVKTWKRLPFVVWLVLAIFSVSWIFVFSTAIVHYGIGLNSDMNLIYLFLVEKAFIIRGGAKRRMQSNLYLFNSFGILTLYVVVCILNFVFRIARMDDGQCIIGVEKIAMIPLITFDILVNVYLTVLFLKPLRKLYSLHPLPCNPTNPRLRAIAMRTLLGTLGTTTSSVVNLTVLMALEGELGWVCLMCCNADILFSALVIQWVTSPDNAGTLSSTADPASALFLSQQHLTSRAFANLPMRAKQKYGHITDTDLESSTVTADRASASASASGSGSGSNASDSTTVPPSSSSGGSSATDEEAPPPSPAPSSPSSRVGTVGRNGSRSAAGGASAAAAVAVGERGRGEVVAIAPAHTRFGLGLTPGEHRMRGSGGSLRAAVAADLARLRSKRQRFRNMRFDDTRLLYFGQDPVEDDGVTCRDWSSLSSNMSQ
ncbi:hypothetical protein F5B20DRAFT_594476 [Whalleya microplaca]|nr:hypothetical protein F5B20DRAFT_594476 [Whalleya microplaca]